MERGKVEGKNKGEKEEAKVEQEMKVEESQSNNTDKRNSSPR